MNTTVSALLGLMMAMGLSVNLAHAGPIGMVPSVEYKGADIDPEGIWSPDELKPFGGANAVRKSKGANITEYKAETPSGDYLLSQVLSDNCSAQLCPARLFKLSGDGTRELLVHDMMHIGGPFTLDPTDKILLNGDYKFEFNQ